MMKVFLAKYRFKIIVALAILFTLINLVNLYFLLEIAPQSNDECLWVPKKIEKDSIGIFFDKVKFEGVTWNAGIRDGDQLLEINGNEINNIFQAQLFLNRIEKGDSAIYKVSRNGEIFETKVEVKKLINFSSLGYALLSFIWVLVGFIVIMAKSEGEVQRLFFALGGFFTLASTAGFFFVGMAQNPYFYVEWMIVLVDFLWFIGSTFLPFYFVYFFWIFPRPNKIIQKKYTKKILFTTPIVLFSVGLIFRIIYVYLKPVNIFSVPKYYALVFYGIYPLLIGIAMIVGFISLIRSYLKIQNPTERTPIFIILLSYGIGLAAILYTSTLANVLADTIFNSPEYFMPIIAVALLPVGFGYAIFRYSLMDVTDVVKNSVYYFTATVSIAATYFLIIYLLGQNISQALSTEYQGLIAGIIFIFFAIVFQSTKDRFQNMLTKRFYPEQFAYQNVLLKFSKEISAIIGLENILDKTTDTIVEALEIRHFAILLKDYRTGNFVLKRGVGTKSDNFVIDNRDRKIKSFLDKKRELHITPVIERSEFEKVFTTEVQQLIDEEIYTIIPLEIKGKIIGLLLFGLKHSGAQFAGKDLELLIASANQIAIAIENARLYQSEAEKLKIDRDIENAKAIQQSLLPNVVPQVNNLKIAGKMIPAMQIGGDYYDLIKINDNKIFVVIADVSGKGLAASFYMSKIQTMMRLYCKDSRSPKEILDEVNSNIFGSIERNWFITLSLAMIDVEKKKVTYCRAGHTPLILVNGNDYKMITPKGLGIGLEKGEIFNSTLEEIEIDLKNNDVLVLYSDGISEDMSPEGKLFGVERIVDNVVRNSDSDVEKIISLLLDESEKFRKGLPQNDDISLVVIKYNE